MSAEPGDLLHPFAWYRHMHETAPVYYDEASYAWHVFRYRDVQRVLSDYEAFSSQMTAGGDHPLDTAIINLDPPRHRKLRSLVAQAFTPRAIAALEPRITAIVHELLDRVAARGAMDVRDDLAHPLPVIVIAELLGIPAADREQFKQWSHEVVFSGGLPPRAMYEYFTRLVERRRHQPRDDLISALLAARVDGEQLTYDELLGFCILLLVAGNVTTTLLLSNAFLCFDEHPQALEQLYADRALLPPAIEEVLRHRAPVRHMYRVSVAETEMAGQRIDAGQFVVAWIGSANHDEAVFADAERFDIARSPNHHIAFGYGIHYCLGAPLARLEARIALDAMLTRFVEMRRVRSIPLEPVAGGILHGVNHFPITFRRN